MSTTLTYQEFQGDMSSIISNSEYIIKKMALTSLLIYMPSVNNYNFKTLGDSHEKSVPTVLCGINPVAFNTIESFENILDDDYDFIDVSLKLDPVNSYVINTQIASIERGKPSVGGIKDFLE